MAVLCECVRLGNENTHKITAPAGSSSVAVRLISLCLPLLHVLRASDAVWADTNEIFPNNEEK